MHNVGFIQGCDQPGKVWGVSADVLAVEAVDVAGRGPMLWLWLAAEGAGNTTMRVAVPLADAERLRAELDAAVEAFGEGDGHD